jgi:hypothetical protein
MLRLRGWLFPLIFRKAPFTNNDYDHASFEHGKEFVKTRTENAVDQNNAVQTALDTPKDTRDLGHWDLARSPTCCSVRQLVARTDPTDGPYRFIKHTP